MLFYQNEQILLLLSLHLKLCVMKLSEIILKLFMEKEISLQEEEITEILKNRLAKYMIPVRYWIADEIPHTLNGKVSKKEIREKVVKFLER